MCCAALTSEDGAHGHEGREVVEEEGKKAREVALRRLDELAPVGHSARVQQDFGRGPVALVVRHDSAAWGTKRTRSIEARGSVGVQNARGDFECRTRR